MRRRFSIIFGHESQFLALSTRRRDLLPSCEYEHEQSETKRISHGQGNRLRVRTSASVATYPCAIVLSTQSRKYLAESFS